jgi:osmotically inducible protein OsmC
VAGKGNALWEGDLKSGHGTFAAGDSISGDYSYNSRAEDGPGSNPEQLIAAAHASCFSMVLSYMLAEAGHRAESVSTEATVTLGHVDEMAVITRIDLVTKGKVPGIDEAGFQDFALRAKTSCPVSRALAGVPEVNLVATLKA